MALLPFYSPIILPNPVSFLLFAPPLKPNTLSDCTSLMHPDAAVPSPCAYSNVAPGTQCQLKCHTGTLAQGNAFYTCTESGVWSGSLECIGRSTLLNPLQIIVKSLSNQVLTRILYNLSANTMLNLIIFPRIILKAY